MKIVIVRHGSTAMNEEGIIIGHLGAHLSAKGRKEAATLGKELADETFDAILSSDLPRAKETAEIIRGYLHHAPPLTFHEELREIDYGELAGRHKQSAKALYSRYHKSLTFQNPEGESFEELSERIISFIRRFEGLYDKVLVVTHAGCIRTFFSFLRGESLRDNMNMVIEHTTIIEGETVDSKPKSAIVIRDK